MCRYLAFIDEIWCTIAAPDFSSHKSTSPLGHIDSHNARPPALNNTSQPECELRLWPARPSRRR